MTAAQSPASLRHALVTGASRGIGREIALRLARDGYALALTARKQDALDDVAAQVKKLGAKAVHVFAADLADAAAVESLARDAAKALNGIDTLINNAGIAVSAPVHKQDIGVFDAMMAVNVRAPMILMKELVPAMKKLGAGRIVNIASVSGIQGDPYISAYCASKHALVGLTRALAKELGGDGITVNAVCPGYVDTEMTRQTVSNITAKTGRTDEQARGELAACNPQGRIFTAQEVAGAVMYLLGPDAGGINGQCLTICGGETA